jgi:hypothetical protein
MKGMSTGMQAAGELWLNRIFERFRQNLAGSMYYDLPMFRYYRDGYFFLCDLIDENPDEPSKYEAINRARAEWAKERDV